MALCNAVHVLICDKASRKLVKPFFWFRFSADTPLAQVKLGEIGSWLARRNKTPQAMVATVSRAWWRWNHKYCQPRRTGIAPFFQLVSGMMVFFYCINSQRIGKHRPTQP